MCLHSWVLNAVANTVSLVDVSDPASPRVTDTKATGGSRFRGVTFDSCNSGSMTYASPLEGYGSGSLGLTRLTNLSGLECR